MNVATNAPVQRAANSPSVDVAVCESLAREFHVPTRQVEALYREELSRLAARARINTFLGVLATRRVRARLGRRTPATAGVRPGCDPSSGLGRDAGAGA